MRQILFGTILAGMMLLTACSETTVQKETIQPATGTVTEAQTSVMKEVPEELWEELWGLIEENSYCKKIFYMGMLPTAEKNIVYDENNTLYEVDPEAFTDYASFEEYIRSVYSKEKADELLYNFPYEGVQKYVNVDGKLYVDIQFNGGKGSYADWRVYKITMISVGDEECQFTLHAYAVVNPADSPVLEERLIEGSVVLEDGKWRLTDILLY